MKRCVTFSTHTLGKRLLNHKRVENYVIVGIVKVCPSTKAERFSLSIAQRIFTLDRANVYTCLFVLF